MLNHAGLANRVTFSADTAEHDRGPAVALAQVLLPEASPKTCVLNMQFAPRLNAHVCKLIFHQSHRLSS